MKIFVDTHILIDYLVNADMEATVIINNITYHYPKPVISTLSLGILNYFIDKKFKQAKRKRAIAAQLSDIFEITTPALKDVTAMLQHDDWEDGFQYYAALQAKCKLLITENTHDYYFSKIQLMTPGEFNAHFL
jgi:predicted nucleic acid-binding protein